MAEPDSIGAHSSKDDGGSPPTPFYRNYWTEERPGDGHDRADLVRLCNRTRSVTLGLETLVGLIEAQGLHDACGEARYLGAVDVGALESLAKVSLAFLHEFAADCSNSLYERRATEAAVAAARHASQGRRTDDGARL